MEMIQATGDTGASMICDLAAAIIHYGKVSSDWEQSFIVSLCNDKGDALEMGNYHSLKLTEQVMKVLERIVDSLISQLVSVDNPQFGFVPGRGTTIFVVMQLQEKYLAANKRLHGFRRSREGVWSSASEGHLVGTEKMMWRSGLCDWCRGCMPMHGAMSVLVRGTVKSLKWGSVFTKALYSARCSSSLCLKPCHGSSALGSPGMTLLSLLNRSLNVSGGSWLGKKQWKRKDWV